MNDRFANWGRLLRLSLSATAIGDVLAGSALAGAGFTELPQVGVLILASLGIYHGGMAFNDWCDREHDASTRPERPIPCGAIPARTALLAALGLFALGPVLAGFVHPLAAVHAVLLAGCAALYDFKGRGPRLGPLLLGLCRFLNMTLPITALGLDAGLGAGVLAAPALYALYLFLLSKLGRLEDGEQNAVGSVSPRSLLFGLAAVFWVLPWLPVEGATTAGRGLALCVCFIASVGLVRSGQGLKSWQPSDVMAAMGCALRRMLPFSASVAFLVGTSFAMAAGVAILLLTPVSFWLRKVFPPS
ncbi:MAG: hypothetical protein ACI9F9_000824 [Candidatus Paceibacteria bacterium]|jgi:hypothetical protein